MQNLKMIIIAFIIATVSFSIVACGSPTESVETTTLENNKWVLQLFGDSDNLTRLIADTRITAEFDGTSRQVTGSAGCNTYFSYYENKGSTISFTDIAVTEMYCDTPEGVMGQEQEFLSLLADAESFQGNDTSLTIMCSDGRNLYFTAIPR